MEDNNNDRLFQSLFLYMVQEISDVRVHNLINKYIKDYREVDNYLNDPTLIYKWHGAGSHSVDKIRHFLENFHQEKQSFGTRQTEVSAVRLAGFDYPFLSEDEKHFVTSFLKNEGRYPVLFIAVRYFQRTNNRHAQVFAYANGIIGGHIDLEWIGEKYALTCERVRQLSGKNVTGLKDAGELWNIDRWKALDFWGQSLLTETNINWKQLQEKEQLQNVDFYAVLTIIRQISPYNIVALRRDGRKANARLLSGFKWQEPDILFAYDRRFNCFSFENALAVVGHQAVLQRITDESMSLLEMINQHFKARYNEEEYLAIVCIMREVIPLFECVKVVGDDIVFCANRTNYTEVIYQILLRKGHAMTIDEIYAEFQQVLPNDHHNDNSFIRNYMLRDQRFEAVGSKSTYQLKEWNRFSGTLGDLAIHLIEKSDKPVKVDYLCRQMMEQRKSTTLKSCNTSVYIAVNANRLLFYIDNFDYNTENVVQKDMEDNRYYVGLFHRQYPARFWPSPLTVEGLIRSMRRFLTENGHWPFSSAKTTIESALYYTLRKYTKKINVTDEEIQRYEKGMADIIANDYPSNERDMLFLKRCRELTDFCEKYHLMPSSGKLLAWYKTLRSQTKQLSEFRQYHVNQMQFALDNALHELPTTPIKTGSSSSEQLLLDFGD